MAGGWRVTARMVATAMAASAVSRAAESVRKLLAEAAPPPALDRPAAPAFLEPPTHLTAEAPMRIDTAGEDRVIAAQAAPGHEFGPTPLVAPSHGIGFRSEPRRREPAAEMPVISRPSGDEPEGRDDVAPAAPVVMPKSVRTAAAFVQDLDDDDEVDEATEEAASEQPEAEQVEPSTEEAEESASEPVAEPPEPEPEPEPVRSLRLTAPPVEDTPITPEPAPVDELVEPPEPTPDPAIVEEPASAKPKDKKSDKAKRPKEKNKDKGKKKDKAKGKHRRHTSAISGTVQSSRGRGLRGMQITVLNDHELVIGTAVSGAGGAFVVEDLPAGSYRLIASDDADGDFAPGWHGGTSFAKADSIKVKEGKTRRKAGVTLVSAAAIDLDVDVRKKKAVVAITVTDRATGAPAEGSVRVSTKLFGTELPLTNGRTAITLLGSAKGSPTLSKKVIGRLLGQQAHPPGVGESQAALTSGLRPGRGSA